MNTAKTEKEERAARAMQFLKKWLKPGSTVYATVTHVSRSGMMRHIKLYIVYKGEIINISWHAAQLLDWTLVKGEHALKVGGCGMDMCFHTVYSLGRRLFPKGFTPAKAGKKYGRNGSPATAADNDGGYALNYKNM